jgi:hypothetical protein
MSVELMRHRLLALSALCPGASTLLGNLLHTAQPSAELQVRSRHAHTQAPEEGGSGLQPSASLAVSLVDAFHAQDWMVSSAQSDTKCDLCAAAGPAPPLNAGQRNPPARRAAAAAGRPRLVRRVRARLRPRPVHRGRTGGGWGGRRQLAVGAAWQSAATSRRTAAGCSHSDSLTASSASAPSLAPQAPTAQPVKPFGAGWLRRWRPSSDVNPLAASAASAFASSSADEDDEDEGGSSGGERRAGGAAGPRASHASATSRLPGLNAGLGDGGAGAGLVGCTFGSVVRAAFQRRHVLVIGTSAPHRARSPRTARVCDSLVLAACRTAFRDVRPPCVPTVRHAHHSFTCDTSLAPPLATPCRPADAPRRRPAAAQPAALAEAARQRRAGGHCLQRPRRGGGAAGRARGTGGARGLPRAGGRRLLGWVAGGAVDLE